MDHLRTMCAAPALSRPTAAEARAGRNWEANRQAFGVTQPDLVADLTSHPLPPLEWVFGRDGSLTALDDKGLWYAGCSLPARAAAAGLRSLDVRGTAACFLAPPHAGYVRVALDRMAAGQALVVVLPEATAAAVVLRCEDFSADLAGRRLWFAWGGRWAERLRQIFDAVPGLPTPSQFVRLPHADPDLVQSLIADGQKVFADVAAKRAAGLRAAREAWSPRAGPRRRVCVVTASRFRLWDDAGFALRDALTQTAPEGVEVVPVDVDDPAAAGPLALATTAAACDVVIAADLARADAPDVIHPGQPWVTWATQPNRLPPPTSAGPRDALLVADPTWREAAVRHGWPPDRVAVAEWPGRTQNDEGGSAVLAGVGMTSQDGRMGSANTFSHSSFIIHHSAFPLALIIDTTPTAPTAAVEEFSSHRLLWETIRQELEADPFAAGDDPAAYLADRAGRYGVTDAGLDRPRFVAGLVRPAYAQTVARLLIGAGLPVRLYGAGWEAVEEFAAHAGGPVADREALARAVAASAALVHAWPARHAHPMDAAGRPVVRAADARNAAELVWAARRALAGGRAPAGPAAPPVSMDLILRLVAAR